MGYQLWVSPLTGYRRKGTKFTALKDIFIHNVTANCIYEPLLCCPVNSDSRNAKKALKIRNFDVAGVKETKDGPVIGYVAADDIHDGDFKKYINEIGQELIISDSTPIAEIFALLSSRSFCFVIYGNNIVGIITRADINKPPVRIYVFGIISLLEMHLNSWINHFYPNNSWVSKVGNKRMDDAKKLYEQRKGNNQELTLLECLQFCDKRDLLKQVDDFLGMFNFSKNKFKIYMEKAETIRNELSHSQNSIISNLEWNEFIKTMEIVEKFLIESDTEVERIAKGGSDFQDLLI
jgi:hypothetical protein